MKFESRTEVIMSDDELSAIDEALGLLKVLSEHMDWENYEVLSCESKDSHIEHSWSQVSEAIALLKDIADCCQIFIE